jgi:hypothetical protein
MRVLQPHTCVVAVLAEQQPGAHVLCRDEQLGRLNNAALRQRVGRIAARPPWGQFPSPCLRSLDQLSLQRGAQINSPAADILPDFDHP